VGKSRGAGGKEEGGGFFPLVRALLGRQGGGRVPEQEQKEGGGGIARLAIAKEGGEGFLEDRRWGCARRKRKKGRGRKGFALLLNLDGDARKRREDSGTCPVGMSGIR